MYGVIWKNDVLKCIKEMETRSMKLKEKYNGEIFSKVGSLNEKFYLPFRLILNR